MIPQTSFYDPNEPQWHYPQHPQSAPSQHQFNFAYPAPGTSYDELLAQFYPNHAAAPPSKPQSPPRASASASASASAASASTSTPAPKRKRVAKKAAPAPAPSAGYSDSESDDGFGGATGISVGMDGLGARSKGARLPGACTHCKKLKMKCDFGMDGDGEMDNTCRRCRAGGHVCIVEGRKPRSAPNKREYLLAQIRQKDAIIESLLKQLHNPYIATPLSIASYRMATSPSDTANRNIIAWLDRLQASVRSGQPLESTTSSAATFAALSRDASATLDSVANGAAGGSIDGSEDGGDGSARNDDDDDGENEHALPDASVPIGLIAKLSLSSNKEKKGTKAPENGVAKEEEDDLDDDNVGVANASYFRPGPSTDLSMRAQLIEQHSPPEILIHGLVVPEDVDKLFDIFWTRVNPFIALLDPVLHTPASTFARCPFLFTVICAISSRYYAEKSEIYPIAMHFAKHSAATALIDGWKSVELVQAYILMSIYAVPARRWEEDRSWLYTGLAIRLATDLNLHQVPTGKAALQNKGNERLEREQLNRTRVWMICFNLDRSTATQFGKPATIKDDYIMRHGSEETWYTKSPFNSTYDIHMCCYTALLRLVARFHDDIFSDPTSPTGLNKRVDFRSVTLAHDAKLERFAEEWGQRLTRDSDPNDRKCIFRCKLFPFLVAYSRLVMFSFGFQQAYQRGLKPADHIFFTKCLESAKGVVRGMVDGLAPTGFMRYSPDGHFIFSCFAAAFLMKLLKPEFSHLLPKDEENEVFNLIGRLIQTLSSPEIAIDDRHTPKLYARFLAGLLSKHRREGATVGRMQPQPQPSQVQHLTHSSASSEYGPSSSASSTFTIAPMPGAGAGYAGPYAQQQQQQQHQQHMYQHREPAYSQQMQYSPEIDLGTGLPDEEQMLAAMQALKNPAWWDNMMMPGFSWPEPSSHSPSAASNTSNGSPSPYQGHAALADGHGHGVGVGLGFMPAHPMEVQQFV
ncbi:hypothetical protein HMN09_00316700 [Mycena chlorophos]|uniref:Zn(2)-C6 fungal-type domain-containing protein n=1 Tax=Mycena chlorophos TaxID=658473 RepID=A0A8H6TG63_MYCCL|nr:hypothetical protein HMN09_00316700 [Mycena chlorophos]